MADLFRYMDTDARTPQTIVFGSFDESVVAKLLTGYPDDWFEVTRVNVDETAYYLALKNFRILEGEPSSSDGSEAIYWARCDCGGYGFEIYTLEPNSETSCHCHMSKIETFTLIAGQAKIRTGDLSLKYWEKGQQLSKAHTVNKGVFHQIVTKGSAALILIKIVGPDPLGRGDHHFASV